MDHDLIAGEIAQILAGVCEEDLGLEPGLEDALWGALGGSLGASLGVLGEPDDVDLMVWAPAGEPLAIPSGARRFLAVEAGSAPRVASVPAAAGDWAELTSLAAGPASWEVVSAWGFGPEGSAVVTLSGRGRSRTVEVVELAA